MKNIKLRALTSDDIEKTLDWNNQADIKYNYSGNPFPVNIEMEKLWYDKILTSNFPVTVFGIELIETKTLIGIAMLKEINLIHRCAEFAIYIGNTEYRGKGLSIEATKETLNFAFNKIGLNRISVKVLEENLTAISLYKKIGFVWEGLLRQTMFKENGFKNEIIMSILKTEFNV